MKKLNKKGFTLMEMLIVIAIIAILIAIAIPTFTNALEKSKIRTDEANARSLKSLVAAGYMAEPDTFATGDDTTYYLKEGGQEYTTTNSGVIKYTSNKYGNGEISATVDENGIVTVNLVEAGD